MLLHFSLNWQECLEVATGSPDALLLFILGRRLLNRPSGTFP